MGLYNQYSRPNIKYSIKNDKPLLKYYSYY